MVVVRMVYISFDNHTSSPAHRHWSAGPIKCCVLFFLISKFYKTRATGSYHITVFDKIIIIRRGSIPDTSLSPFRTTTTGNHRKTYNCYHYLLFFLLSKRNVRICFFSNDICYNLTKTYDYAGHI